MEYKTGTVKLVNASAIVRGDSALNFSISVLKGDLFKRQSENVFYTVASVINATTIQLSSTYAGVSRTGQAFVVVRDFTPTFNFPEMSMGDQDFPDIYTRAVRSIDEQFASLEASLVTPTFAGLNSSAAIILDNNQGVYGKHTDTTSEHLISISVTNIIYIAYGAAESIYIGDAATDANPVFIRVGSATQNVTASANNSAGAGYRMLRVPNA